MEKFEDIQDLFDLNPIYRVSLSELKYADFELPEELDIIDESLYDNFYINRKHYDAISQYASILNGIIVGEYLLLNIYDSLRFVIVKSSGVEKELLNDSYSVNLPVSNNSEVSIKYFEIAKDIYGEDNVKLYSRKEYPLSTSSSRESLVIYMEDLEIENKHGVKLKMPNFFAMLQFDSNSLRNSFYGIRTDFSSIERAREYMHSHYSASSPFKYMHDYCTGGSTALLTNALNRAYEDNDEDEIYNLFYSINNFIKWEDIDGVPHKYLSNMLSQSNSSRTLEAHEIIELVKQHKECINVYNDINGPEVDIDFSQLTISEENNSYIINGRPYKNCWNDYNSTINEPFCYFKNNLIRYNVESRNPFNLENLTNTNDSHLNISNERQIETKQFFKSKLLSFLNYELKPTQEKDRIKDTLIGLEKVSRLSKNNSFE